jgi:methylenetetrahydrofolate dehydrogenase (NADP+)/methenyltetrahydrofolate cyclohydrolase
VQAKIIDGNLVAARIRDTIAEKISERVSKGFCKPGVAVILMGNNPASEVYVRNKHQDCQSVGMYSEVITLPETGSQDDLLNTIHTLNARKEIHGILVQLPLPAHIDTTRVLESILPSKDVDGFHPYNMGRLAVRQPLLRPCTPKGIMTLLETTGISLSGKDAVVIGQSNIVGRPMALELLAAGCTVTICHSKTRELQKKCSTADILIAATGQPKMIKKEWIQPGAVVIDVGITRSGDGKLSGDVDFDEASQVASWITPVPGGVGPMTRASLLENTLQAALALD